MEMLENCRYADMRTFYEALHQRTMTEFAEITNEKITKPSLGWEGEAVSLLYRL